MIDFRYQRPSSLEEAFDMFEQAGENKILAGGTDLVVGIRDRKIEVDSVISLADLEDLHQVTLMPDGSLRIGAACTIAELIANKDVKDFSQAFVSAISGIGSNQIRNRATIGGNLCNASPAADSVPLLLTFEAEVELVSRKGTRRVLVNDFLMGKGKIDLEKGELLTSIILPNEARELMSFYEKVGVRSMDISMVSVAVSFVRDKDGYKKMRIAMGSVETRPIRAYDAEDYLESHHLADPGKLGELLAKEVRQRDSIRASSEYRREIVQNLVFKALKMDRPE